MKKLILVIVTVLLTTASAQAGNKWDYDTHPKYRFVFCNLTQLPIKWCHRIKR